MAHSSPQPYRSNTLRATAVVATPATAESGIIATIHSARLQHPFALVVDERTRRVFALSRGPVDGRSGRQTGRGLVSTIDAASGRLLRSTTVGAVALGVFAIAVAERAGHVFVANVGGTAPYTDTPASAPPRPGSLSMLDAATGRLLRTIIVGPGPVAVAVSDRFNRVFVLNADSSYYSQAAGPARISALDASNGRLVWTAPLPSPRLAPAGSFAVVVDDRTGGS